MEGGSAIPPQVPAAHRIHLDTCYVRPVLLDWDQDPDALDAARGLVYGSAAGSLAVSLPSLGEVLVTALREPFGRSLGRTDPLQRARELVHQGRIGICGFGTHQSDSGYLECVNELRTADYELETSDALIVSAALCCSECDQFYTNDGAILRSRVIRKAADDRNVRIINPS